MLVNLVLVGTYEGRNLYKVEGTECHVTLKPDEIRRAQIEAKLEKRYENVVNEIVSLLFSAGIVGQSAGTVEPAVGAPDSPADMGSVAPYLDHYDGPNPTPAAKPAPTTADRPAGDGAAPQGGKLPAGLNILNAISDKKSIAPYRVNDDAGRDGFAIDVDTIVRISDAYTKSEEALKRKIAEYLSNAPLDKLVKYADKMPQELRRKVAHIIANRDGENTSFIPASVAVLNGEKIPDIRKIVGDNTPQRPGKIPEGWDNSEEANDLESRLEPDYSVVK